MCSSHSFGSIHKGFPQNLLLRSKQTVCLLKLNGCKRQCITRGKLSDERKIRVDDDSDDRVAAGCLTVGHEQDRLPVGWDLH